MHELKANIDAYIFESQRSKKESLKNEIDQLKWDLIESTLKEQGEESKLSEVKNLRKKNIRPFFIWELEFSDVFINNGGFDVVIGNPPYAGERKHKDIFTGVQQGNLKEFYFGRMDFFYFFFHLALEIGKRDAQCAFITTNYFITALGARKLRADLKRRSIIKNLINFNELRIFESALGQHNMITIFSKASNGDFSAQTAVVNKSGTANEDILTDIMSGLDAETIYNSLKQEEIYEGEENYIRLNGNVSISGSEIQSILGKLVSGSQNLTLGTACEPIIGLESSADDVYVIDNKEIDSIIENDFEREFFKPFFKNSDISKFHHKRESTKSIFNKLPRQLAASV